MMYTLLYTLYILNIPCISRDIYKLSFNKCLSFLKKDINGIYTSITKPFN